MAIHEVRGPDGAIHQIDAPESATPEQVIAFAQQSIATPQAQSDAAPMGAGQSFMQGIADPANGLAQLGLHAAQYLPDSISPDGLKGADQYLDNKLAGDEQTYQAARSAAGRDGTDWSRMAGSVLATLPETVALPGGGAKLASRIGAGALNGTATAAAQPITEGAGDDYGLQKLEQVGAGFGVGGGLGGITGGLSKAIRPTVSKDVQTLLDNNVTPTPGQILGGGYSKMEDKLTSVPGLGTLVSGAQKRALDDFNTAALSRAVAPVWGKDAVPSAIGREGLQGVKDSLSTAYNAILPNLTFKADPQFMGEISSLQNLASNLPEQQSKQFGKILQQQIFGKLGPQGTMDGLSYKGAESELGNAAKGYLSDSSYDSRQLGSALKEAASSMKGALSRANPNEAPALADINNGYAQYAILRNAGSKLGQEDAGVFTPAQLQSSVRAADKSAGKGNFATGNARMQDLSDAGKAVLGSKYPDSGTAGREMMGVLMGSMLEGGGAIFGHPLAPLAAGMTALPYTQTGQKLAAALLTKRPNIAKPIGNAVANSGKYIANGVTPAFLPGYEGAYQ